MKRWFSRGDKGKSSYEWDEIGSSDDDDMTEYYADDENIGGESYPTAERSMDGDSGYVEDVNMDRESGYCVESGTMDIDGEAGYYPEEAMDMDDKSGYCMEDGSVDGELGYYQGNGAMEGTPEYYTNDDVIGETSEYYVNQETMEGTLGHYVGDEAVADGNLGYYADDGTADVNSCYYADDETTDQSCLYYAEDGTADGESGYDEDTIYEDTAIYEAIDEITDDTDEANFYAKDEGRRSRNFFRNIGKGFFRMRPIDKVMAISAAVVLVLTIFTGSVYAAARATDRQVASFADVGRQLSGMRIPGEAGLMAAANAQRARMEAHSASDEETQVEVEEPEPNPVQYEEEEYIKEIAVTLNLTSIQKDLKIKFINKDTKKLIHSVPFNVTITDPDGKTSVWSDDDKDGIIYKEDIASGKYTVLVNRLEGEKYSEYILPASGTTVEVKKEIVYEKVDVSDEIKTEAEIDVSKEDAGANTNRVESVLQDTLEWVASSSMPMEVLKDTIPDPVATSFADAVLRLGNAGGISEKGRILNTGGSFQLSATYSGGAPIGDTTTRTIAWSSDNPSVASVNQDGLVTGVARGNALISYTMYEVIVSENDAVSSTLASDACIVWVDPGFEWDTATLLKDAQGNELYVQAGADYRLAVYADYYSAGKFFTKTVMQYTGWQTLDGKVYFYDKNGNKAVGEHVIQGARYTFASDGSLVAGNGTMGIDVSKWNNKIDWNAVKNSGVSFVIIRCGYRGYTEGSLVIDPQYHANIKGAIAAGLKVGVYFFTQAVNEREAVEEASMVLELVKNYKISYPIFLDVESSGGRGDKITKEMRTAVCLAFCQTIKSAGYTSGIYANKTWLTSMINTGQLSAYKIWLAQYATTPSYTGRYDIWQYSSTGKISGISGNVDLNISYLGY